MKRCLQWDLNPRPASAAGKLALLTDRPRQLDDDLWFDVLQDSGMQIYKTGH